MSIQTAPKATLAPIGILLINLGTPDMPTTSAVRRYLREFLSDTRVVELPRLLWQPLLNLVVLQTAAPRSAKNYRKIWDMAEMDSPLRLFTRKQAEKLQIALEDSGENVRVAYGMRYGKPSLKRALDDLKSSGCERIVLLPLYPQYASSTTGTAYQAVFKVLQDYRWIPAINTVAPYYNHPAYIEALANSIRPQLDEPFDKLVLSFHGLPQFHIDKGDPYARDCRETARLLTEALKLPADKVALTFQSRFGKGEWLKPATDETLEQLAKSGNKRVVIATPGFFSDCIETLEEIHIQGEETFMAHGGESYKTVSCLNDSAAAITLLQTLLAPHLAD